MNPTPANSTVGELLNAQLASAEARAAATAALAEEHEDSPWLIKALTAVGAWLAMIPLTVFLVAADIVNNATQALVAGALVLCIAVAVRRSIRPGDFARQFLLALSMTGQALMTLSAGSEADELGAGAIMIALSAGLFWLYPDALHRFLAVCVATAGALIITHSGTLSYASEAVVIAIATSTAVVWHYLDALAGSHWHKIAMPLAYGLLASLLAVCAPTLAAEEFAWQARPWLASVGIGVVFLVSSLGIHNRLNPAAGSLERLYLVLPCIALVAALSAAPGVLAAILALSFAFMRAERLARNIACTGLAIYLSAYYYQLDTTLLNKSLSLCSAGLLLLGLRVWVSHVLRKEIAHAD
jgi:hypothetical protein